MRACVKLQEKSRSLERRLDETRAALDSHKSAAQREVSATGSSYVYAYAHVYAYAYASQKLAAEREVSSTG